MRPLGRWIDDQRGQLALTSMCRINRDKHPREMKLPALVDPPERLKSGQQFTS